MLFFTFRRTPWRSFPMIVCTAIVLYPQLRSNWCAQNTPTHVRLSSTLVQCVSHYCPTPEVTRCARLAAVPWGAPGRHPESVLAPLPAPSPASMSPLLSRAQQSRGRSPICPQAFLAWPLRKGQPPLNTGTP